MKNELSVFRSKAGEKLILEEYENLINSIGVPYEEKYINTRSGKTHIIVTGQSDKPAVILIHAFYATAASWYGAFMELSKNYRVFAVDIIGDPNKSSPIKPIRLLTDFLDWFNDLMNELNLESADFVGNSVGAFHIANFALHFPHRVKHMVLIGPAATFKRITAFYIHTFPGGITGWPFLVRHAVKWIENGIPFHTNFRRLFYLTLRYGKSANQVFPIVFKDEDLQKINTATLLIFGEQEVIYNTSSAIARARKHMKNVKIVTIPNANHITLASNALPVNEAILKFLMT